MGEAGDGALIAEITVPGVRRSVKCARGFVRDAVLGDSRRGGRAPGDRLSADEAPVDGVPGDGMVPGDKVLGDMVVDDMVTVASETVANAITHTASGLEGGRVTVAVLFRDGAYRLEVGDDGAGGGRPHVMAEVGAETGRGMRIVEALASRWGFRVEGARTVVWAEFRAPAPGPGH